MLIFASILILTEASVLESRSYFYFLNFGWGKGLANIFIACIMLGSGAAVPWLDIITSIYLIVLAVLHPLITILHRPSEYEWVDWKLEQIKQQRSAKANALQEEKPSDN